MWVATVASVTMAGASRCGVTSECTPGGPCPALISRSSTCQAGLARMTPIEPGDPRASATPWGTQLRPGLSSAPRGAAWARLLHVTSPWTQPATDKTLLPSNPAPRVTPESQKAKPRIKFQVKWRGAAVSREALTRAPPERQKGGVNCGPTRGQPSSRRS